MPTLASLPPTPPHPLLPVTEQLPTSSLVYTSMLLSQFIPANPNPALLLLRSIHLLCSCLSSR